MMTDAAAQETGSSSSGPSVTAPSAPTSPAYAWYVLFILFLVHSFNAIDRAIVNILVEPIRQEFGFSDFQIGIISGLGFALFYTVLGIPIARWADRGNRRNILALGLAVWSGMTALTGRAVGFWSMLGARIGVGVGEASCYPTAYPLISDYFEKAKRPRAIALFQTGLFAGIIVGAALAGKIAEAHGWRAAFAAIGLPGIILAVVVILTVKEPPRGMSEPGKGPPMITGKIGDMIGLLVANRAFMLLIVASTFLTITSATMGSWGPAFLMRLHGVSQGEVGMIAGPVIGSGGILGTVFGGFLGTWLAQRHGTERAPIAVPLFTSLASIPFLLMFIFGATLPVVLVGGAVAAFMISAHMGPTIAVAIGIVSPSNRGLASSLVVVGQLLLGFGLGPTLVGAISTGLSGSLGNQALRYALLINPACAVLGWLCMLAAWRKIGALPASGPLARPG